MSLWKMPDVSAQPEVVAEPWIILEAVVKPLPEVAPPYRFVVCYDRSQHCGRVSGLIVECDLAKKRVRTKSGRIYVLRGPPSVDADAWHVWRSVGGSIRAKDVSGEFWPGYSAGSANLVDSRAKEIEAAIKAEARSKSASFMTGPEV